MKEETFVILLISGGLLAGYLLGWLTPYYVWIIN